MVHARLLADSIDNKTSDLKNTLSQPNLKFNRLGVFMGTVFYLLVGFFKYCFLYSRLSLVYSLLWFSFIIASLNATFSIKLDSHQDVLALGLKSNFSYSLSNLIKISIKIQNTPPEYLYFQSLLPLLSYSFV